MIFCRLKQTKKQGLTRDNERGSIIVWILIAVALFAALNYTFSQGFRGGAENIGKEKAKLVATELIEYGGSIREAVQMLRINGCEDNEISFENNIVSGYNNPSAPTDDTCDVFEPEGAGLSWTTLTEDAWDDVDGNSGLQLFSGFHCVDGVGNCNLDGYLMFFLYDTKTAVCEAVDEQMDIDISSGIPTENFSGDKFQGIYGTSGASKISFTGKPTGCFQDNAGATSGRNFFYHVIMVR